MNREAALQRLRADALRAAEAALAAVEPGRRVREALEAQPLTGPCRVFALGKAAAAMVEGALEQLGEQVRGGVAIVPGAEDVPAALGAVATLPGAHPLPDESSALAGQRLLDEAARLGDDETALVLLSGGASALAAVPIEGTSSKELAGLTAELLRSGAPIGEINEIRSALSRTHGGGLSAAIGPRPARTLAISDVPGDVARDIGSAPMHEDSPSGERVFQIVASGRGAALAARDALAREGYLVELDEEALTGEAEPAAAIALLRLRASGSGARALVGWGEPSVRVGGSGSGGRCTHAALAAALRLAERKQTPSEFVFFALASDGRDGSSNSAGACVDCGSVERARARGRDPLADLCASDSARALGASGDLLPESPTGTNVADIWIALSEPCDERLVSLEQISCLRFVEPALSSSPTPLVRGELRRALLAAAGQDGSELAIERAWTPDEPDLAEGWSVELAPLSPASAHAVRERGLDPDSSAARRWRLSGRSSSGISPSWSRALVTGDGRREDCR